MNFYIIISFVERWQFDLLVLAVESFFGGVKVQRHDFQRHRLFVVILHLIGVRARQQVVQSTVNHLLTCSSATSPRKSFSSARSLPGPICASSFTLLSYLQLVFSPVQLVHEAPVVLVAQVLVLHLDHDEPEIDRQVVAQARQVVHGLY